MITLYGSSVTTSAPISTTSTLGVTGASTLDGVTVTDNTISSNDSNANLEINANGTGTVNLENLKIGTSGSTVTTILDEDAMGTNSATALATQQSIKAYVDSKPTGQGFKVVGDDSASVDIAEGGTVYIQGGTNVTTATDSAGVVTINATAGGSGDITSVVAGTGLTGGGLTGDVTVNVIGGTGITANANDIAIDATVATLAGSQTFTNKVLTTPTINGATMTGVVNIDNLNFDDNIISSDSNANISIQPAGTGDLILGAVKIHGTTISSDDSTKITVAEAVDITGALTSNTSLALATGATVTGILDEDAMGTNSATQLATQQSIKAYVDSQSHGGGSIGDLSVVGSTLSSPSNADLTLTTSGTGDIVLDALRINGTTLDSSDSSKITIAEALDITGALTSNTSLALATGATVTGIDNGTIGSSATLLATQGAIKTYADTKAVLTGSTNNTIATVTGAHALNGEANLLFDGSTLGVTGNITATTTIAATTDITAGGNISSEAIQLVDNKISASRTNDTLFLEPAGTGLVNIGNADFVADVGSLWYNSYGAVSNVKGNAFTYSDLTHTAGTDGRVYGNVFQTSIKTDGADTTSSNARWRGVIVNTSLDLNGSSITHSGRNRGVQGVNMQAFITNTSADAGVLSTATGFVGYVYVSPQSGSGDFTLTNAIGCSASGDFSASSLAADKTLTITNSFSFFAANSFIYGGDATKVVTNGYSFYAEQQTVATNNWQFYEATSAGTNSQNRLGAIQLINQASAPTNLADHSWIYALDDSSSSEVYVRDEAGNATKISPHNKEGEWEYYSVNSVTGKTVRVNMERMIKKIEELTGESFIENE